jgi:hypothetical protein
MIYIIDVRTQRSKQVFSSGYQRKDITFAAKAPGERRAHATRCSYDQSS